MDTNRVPDPDDNNKSDIPANNDGITDNNTPPVAGMTLENIIDQTGEIVHLNELIMLHIDKAGGFSCTESYFCIVQPILDLLEVEIRVRYHSGMNAQEMKLLIQDWIDNEIAEVKKC
jgi:hypothetical protein